jgi:hypothetical protein
MGNDWRQSLIAILQVLSILAAAGFAALALLTDYKKDGRITRHGRWAVLGIVLSALLSLATQWASAAVDRDKDRRASGEKAAELVRSAARYRSQIVLLRAVIGREREAIAAVGRTQDRVSASLVQLGRLQTRVTSGIRAVRVVGEQEDRHTAHVLRTLWEDSNRVDSNSIVAGVTFTCENVRDRTLPRLLPQGLLAVFKVSDRNPDTGSPGSESEVLVAADSTHTDVPSERTDGRYDMIESDVYSVFRGELRDFARIERWRGAWMTFTVAGDAPGLFAAYAAASGDRLLNHPSRRRAPAGPGERLMGDAPEARQVIPCDASLTLFLNGRQIGHAEGFLYESAPGSEGAGSVKLLFPPFKVEPEALPRFER